MKKKKSEIRIYKKGNQKNAKMVVVLGIYKIIKKKKKKKEKEKERLEDSDEERLDSCRA